MTKQWSLWIYKEFGLKSLMAKGQYAHAWTSTLGRKRKRKKRQKATLYKLLQNSENLPFIASISIDLVTNLHICINDFELLPTLFILYYLKTFISLNLKDKRWDFHWNIFHV